MQVRRATNKLRSPKNKRNANHPKTITVLQTIRSEVHLRKEKSKQRLR